jgi:predicted MFS family arabinose efflux permease
MTTATLTAPAVTLAAAPRPRIMSRALVLVLAANVGALTSLYLLLSVVALYAGSVGAGGVGAGMATGALMLSTVVAELATPRLVARFGYRKMFAAGLVLLGVPALALTFLSSMTAILVVCVVRGLGFAVIMVVAGALVATLVPAERRGEGLGIAGIAAGVPGVVALPLGLWLAPHVGFAAVFVIASVVALAGLAAVPGIPDRASSPDEAVGVVAALRDPALLRPSLVFVATTVAAGVVVAFVPLALSGAAGALVAPALFVQAATATAARWWSGRRSDRRGPAGQLIPGLVLAAVGTVALVFVSSPVAVLVGMAVFGFGFGMIQSCTMALMLSRVSAASYGTVSAVWNMAYDFGYGAGPMCFGVLAVATGYPAAFAVTAALMLTALSPARRARN